MPDALLFLHKGRKFSAHRILQSPLQWHMLSSAAVCGCERNLLSTCVRMNVRALCLMSDSEDQAEDASVRSTTTECGICMDPLTDRGKLDSCDHKYCFSCIKEWSKKSTECPLCRKNFKRIEPTENAGQGRKRRKTRVVLKKKKKLKLAWNDYGLSEAWNQAEIDWSPSRSRRGRGGGATVGAQIGPSGQGSTASAAPRGARRGRASAAAASLIDLVDTADGSSPPPSFRGRGRGRGRGAAAAGGSLHAASSRGSDVGHEGQGVGESLIFVNDSQEDDDYVELLASSSSIPQTAPQASGSRSSGEGGRGRTARAQAGVAAPAAAMLIVDDEADMPALLPAVRAPAGTGSASAAPAPVGTGNASAASAAPSSSAAGSLRAPRPGSKAYKQQQLQEAASAGAAALLADAQASVDLHRRVQAEAKASARAQARKEEEEEDDELTALLGGAAAALKRRKPLASLYSSDSEEEAVPNRPGVRSGLGAAGGAGTGTGTGLTASTLRSQMNALDPERAERGKAVAAPLLSVGSSTTGGGGAPSLSGRPVLPTLLPGHNTHTGVSASQAHVSESLSASIGHVVRDVLSALAAAHAHRGGVPHGTTRRQ